MHTKSEKRFKMNVFWTLLTGSIPAGGTFTRTLCFQRRWLQTLKKQGFFDAQTERCVHFAEREIHRFSEKVHTKVHTTHGIKAKKYG